jgi:DNA-directed RNA polymerase specialized sigma subunit
LMFGVSVPAVSQMHKRAMGRLKISLGVMGVRAPSELFQ